MDKTKIKPALLMILATFLFGSSFVAVKQIGDTLSPIMISGIKMTIGGISIAIIFAKRLKNTNKKLLIHSAIMGALYAAGLVMQSYGIIYTNAGRGAFLTSAYCIFMPFLEWVILKNKPKLAALLSALTCFIGIGLVALTESFTIDGGDLFTLGSSVAFGFWIVLLSIFVKEDDGALLNVYMLTFGGVILLAISFIFEPLPTAIGTDIILPMFYLAVLCSGIPLVLQAIAQKELSPTVTTVILGFEAIFATVCSTIILGETFSLRCIIGFALIFLSVFVSLIKMPERKKKITE